MTKNKKLFLKLKMEQVPCISVANMRQNKILIPYENFTENIELSNNKRLTFIYPNINDMVIPVENMVAMSHIFFSNTKNIEYIGFYLDNLQIFKAENHEEKDRIDCDIMDWNKECYWICTNVFTSQRWVFGLRKQVDVIQMNYTPWVLILPYNYSILAYFTYYSIMIDDIMIYGNGEIHLNYFNGRNYLDFGQENARVPTFNLVNIVNFLQCPIEPTIDTAKLRIVICSHELNNIIIPTDYIISRSNIVNLTNPPSQNIVIKSECLQLVRDIVEKYNGKIINITMYTYYTEEQEQEIFEHKKQLLNTLLLMYNNLSVRDIEKM